MTIGQLINNKPITIDENASIKEVLDLMISNDVKRLLVVDVNQSLIGVIERKDICITMLRDLRDDVRAKDIVNREIITVDAESDIGFVSKVMADQDLTFVVVLDTDDNIVSLITKTDIFKVLVELLGARHFGVRLTVELEERPGALAQLLAILSNEGANIVSLGTVSYELDKAIVTMKLQNIKKKTIEAVLGDKGTKILSIKDV